MNVSAAIVTRGDVPLDEVLDSLPRDWQKVVWDNSRRADLGVYGRYAAIAECEHDLVYVQDDDVIVSDPQAIVDAWLRGANFGVGGPEADPQFQIYPWGKCPVARDVLVCNMPPEFRHDFYRDHALVGFGAVFHRDAPERAFNRWEQFCNMGSIWEFRRCCDIAFTALTPRVLVDVPKRNLPWCDAPNRMWKQPDHQGERAAFLADVLRIRDASV